jgi:hypothetical protein
MDIVNALSELTHIPAVIEQNQCLLCPIDNPVLIRSFMINSKIK